MISDELDRSTVEVASKAQLLRFGQFFDEYNDRSFNLCADLQLFHSDLDYIRVETGQFESASVTELVYSGNSNVDKVVRVLAALCEEVRLLRRDAQVKFVPALLVYAGVGGASDGDAAESDSLRSISAALPCIQELSVFVQRVYEVVRNIVHQLAALFGPNSVVNCAEIQLDVVFEALGRLLVVLILLDEVIANHASLKEHWNNYLRAVQLVHHNPKKFSVDVDNLRPLESILAKLDSQLMSGYIFQNCAEQPFDTTQGVNVTGNGLLQEQFTAAIRNLFRAWERRNDEATDKTGLMVVCSLFVLQYFIFRSADKKTVRLIWDSYKKLPALHLAGNIIWTPCHFLTAKVANIDKLVEKKAISAVANYRSYLIQQQSHAVSREAQSYVLKVGDWSSQMARSLQRWPATDIHTELHKRLLMFMRGLKMVEAMQRLAATVLNGHLLEGRAMSQSTVDAVFRLAELIKTVEATFSRHWALVTETLPHLTQQLSARLLKLTTSAKAMLRNDKRYSEQRVDSLSSFVVLENVLAGPTTEARCAVATVALSLGSYSKLLRDDEALQVEQLVSALQSIAELSERLARATDCSFLFWHRALLPSYFDRFLRDGCGEPLRLLRLFEALNDGVRLAKCARDETAETAARLFEADIFDILEKDFLSHLCETIETDLRLSMHSQLQLDERNPFKGHAPVALAALFRLPALRLHNKAIDLKRYVELYLERTFYNLTTVALHDWRTYAEMRQQAGSKFGLALVEPHLPSQTLEQGLDVLEVMRNIHVFVARYNYNLNMQCFLERESNNKHLNTLNVRHIANSIRTHGSGIMNTTVNFTYQFLKKKFHIFSQFLYDEHIKSQLQKDRRFFIDRFEELDRMYPVEKAEKFNRGIRKLGVHDGFTYLDRFRILITQIGNALGYVRLVRSGGLEASARAIEFVPDMDDIVPLAPLCDEAALSAETQSAARHVDESLAALVTSFADATEYFKILVDVFAGEFRNFDKYEHLKLFYVIVPALTVNFVDHLLGAKERIGKRAQYGAATFTDDGFMMGVAYILKLLDQYEDFDSLHWFQSVQSKCIEERRRVKQEEAKSGPQAEQEKFAQAMALKLTRLDAYKKEFDLVAFAMRSARIFFRTDFGMEIIPREKEISSETGSVKSDADCAP